MASLCQKTYPKKQPQVLRLLYAPLLVNGHIEGMVPRSKKRDQGHPIVHSMLNSHRESFAQDDKSVGGKRIALHAHGWAAAPYDSQDHNVSRRTAYFRNDRVFGRTVYFVDEL
jgi:hypothetical protein